MGSATKQKKRNKGPGSTTRMVRRVAAALVGLPDRLLACGIGIDEEELRDRWATLLVEIAPVLKHGEWRSPHWHAGGPVPERESCVSFDDVRHSAHVVAASDEGHREALVDRSDLVENLAGLSTRDQLVLLLAHLPVSAKTSAEALCLSSEAFRQAKSRAFRRMRERAAARDTATRRARARRERHRGTRRSPR